MSDATAPTIRGLHFKQAAADSTYHAPTIFIWRFDNAPDELRALSPHGGDEEYVALIAPDAPTPTWMDHGATMAWSDVSEHILADGWRVYIGAH